MKQWWIRPGKYTSRYASEDVFDAESNLLPAKSSVWLDDFYPCVTEHEFSNGIHVIEYAEYEKLLNACKKFVSYDGTNWPGDDEVIELAKTISELDTP